MIAKNEIHVFRIEPPDEDQSATELITILSKDEIERANRFKFIKDRNNFINCRSFLRKQLSSYLALPPAEINIVYSDKGKPFLESSDLKFNLSHSHGFGVLALTLSDEIGVDTEKLREIPDAIKISERYFSKGEISQLRNVKSSDIGKVFLNCWTRKEAFIKAVGDGLSYPLKDFEVTILPGTAPEVLSIKDKAYERTLWKLYDIHLKDDHITSLAVKNHSKQIFIKS